jgi:hypothetical protein
MTRSSLARRIETVDRRRSCVAAAFGQPHPFNMRARLYPAVATMRPTADLPMDHRTRFEAQGPRLPGHNVSDTLFVKLAKMIAVALVLIAGVLSFDLLVLWVAAGRLIARIPF